MAKLEDTVCINIMCIVCGLPCSQSVDLHTSSTERNSIKIVTLAYFHISGMLNSLMSVAKFLFGIESPQFFLLK